MIFVTRPRDCFETFPFPDEFGDAVRRLSDTGREYYEYRAALMVRNDQGLTATYNRFHDPDEHDPGNSEATRIACGDGSRRARCLWLDGYSTDL